MTRDESKGEPRGLHRWGALLAIVVAILTIAAVAFRVGDDRYVRQSDYKQDIGDMKSDLRVLRCRVAGDCR